VELTLNLKFDKSVPQYQTIDYDSKAGGSYKARYVVGLYRYAGENPEPRPDYIFAFLEDSMEDRSYTVEVAPLNYRVLVWCDYVDGTSAFYTSPVLEYAASGNTEDLSWQDAPSEEMFSEVSLVTGAYTGNSPWREAFYGTQDVRLATYLSNREKHSMDMPMERSQARFNFVATDKEEFISYWTARGTKSYDLSDLGVRISYPQFLPCTFSLMQERPVDARGNVEFSSKVTVLDDGTIDLGYDWVFANADQTSVVVTLSFYDAAGQFISSLNNITVPLCRGKNTTIRGALLTNGVDSGISIDPNYDGVIVVPL
jgi:hypothetical protein